MTEAIYTIGVYGTTVDTFFGTLKGTGIDLFLDIRRRRGLRGSQHAYANATRLQEELQKLGISYRHLLDLAPLPETRELQNSADTASHTAKRKREELDPAFAAAYTQQTLEPFDWEGLANEIREFRRPVLFCVERLPQACHRRLTADRLAEAMRVTVEHLMP